MLFTGLTLLGYISYKHLPVELLPSAELPSLFVQVRSTVPVDPKQMEREAIVPLEGTIGQLKGVKEIESIAASGEGRIRISYQPGVNMKYAYIRLMEKINEKAATLPEEYRVQALKFDMQQVNNRFMTIQARGSGGVDRVRHIVDRDILSRLQNIDGIANVEVYGGRQKMARIVLNKELCEAHDISPTQIAGILRDNNQPRVFAGYVAMDGQTGVVNVSSELAGIEDIRELVVREAGPLRIKDIADVSFGVKEETSYSRVNGKETVTITLTKTTEANLIELSRAVQNQIDLINEELREADVELAVQSNTAETMEENIDMIIMLAIIGGILAIFVLWIFLKNFLLVATVGLAIPVSVFAAFNFFYAFDISINSFTLMGVALAVGMLLDNSIVVMENIYRHAANRLPAGEATKKGVKEVWRSIVASTLTTVMVFLPFAFSENLFVKLLGKNIGVSVISMLAVSLAASLLLAPMIVHTFLKRKKTGKIRFERFSVHNRFVQIYLTLLKAAMRKPAATIVGAITIFFITLIVSFGVGQAGKQSNETKELTLYIDAPKGFTLESTDNIVRKVEEKLLGIEECEEAISQVYEEEASIKIKLADDYQRIRNLTIGKLRQDILNQIKDIKPGSYSFSPTPGSRGFSGGSSEMGIGLESMLGMRSGAEKIVIKGDDFERMLAVAENIRYNLSNEEYIAHVNIGAPSKSPGLTVDFDQYLMAVYNIQPSAIASELRAAEKEINAGVALNLGAEKYDIVILTTPGDSLEEAGKDLDGLKATRIKNQEGASFEMREIAGFDFTRDLTAINRKNQAKILEVHYSFQEEVNIDQDILKASQNAVDMLVASMPLPSGTAVETVHDDRDFSDFPFLIFASILLIYMILASVFESFIKPFVMMFTIPLAAIGSFIALIITGNPVLNFVTLTGLIILIGIVVNNGILLIDYAGILKQRGCSQEKALMKAGLARLRPILIISITTIVALIPTALGNAEYVSQLGAPFAITIIGGLSVSALLTLVFIPTFHSALGASLAWIYSRKMPVKLAMLGASLSSFYLIYSGADSFLWQSVLFLLTIILVPATTWFIQNSLKKANEKIIDPNEQIVIKIRNLVKIYDWDSRFMRDWKSGARIRQRLGIRPGIHAWRDFDRLLWQVPALAFGFYFLYEYLENRVWQYLLPPALHIFTLAVLRPAKDFLSSKKAILKYASAAIYHGFFWGYPAFAALHLYGRFKLVGLVIVLAIIWHFLILIKVAAVKLHKDNVNIARLTGRFKGIRKSFFRLVLAIPVIGKKKKPFKALKGATFDIGHGMFGLLGPNGAGKSTLMRIICGLLEPSYGQILINGIDVKEKREELQGLIGYLPQEFGMYENLPAEDFLHYMAIIRNLVDEKERAQRVDYALKAVHLYPHKDKKIGSFSGGMRQRLGIAQILLHLPRILVVDEPTSGLDPRERIRFRNLLVELSKERIVIFSTHIIEDVASSCNKVAVIREGEVKYLGAPMKMVRLAEGKVWTVDISPSEFNDFKNRHVIIHHAMSGDMIRARCLAHSAPHPKAKSVNANLEDAYLYLLYELKMEKRQASVMA